MTEVFVEQPRLHRVCWEAFQKIKKKKKKEKKKKKKMEKLVELVGGGSVINGAYPV